MKRSIQESLCCPDCRSELVLQGGSGGEILESGDLVCSLCKRSYEISDGIPQFISIEDLDGLNKRFARFYKRYSRFENFFNRLSFLTMGRERKMRSQVLGRLELGGGRILEVSVGSGGNLKHLFESSGVGEVFGLDISPDQLFYARQLVEKQEWPVELFLGMAEALPFRDNSFDNVFHIGGINFFSDKKRAIDEMVRVAKPGSRIVIADESEHVARMAVKFLRLSRFVPDGEVDISVPIQLVPETMKEVQTYGIWKMHGQFHGYILEFRKPATGEG